MQFNKITSRAVIGMIVDALGQPSNTWVDKVATRYRSNQESEDYGWLGTSPIMREWIAGRQAKGLIEYEYSIKNKPFEATLEVFVDDLRRDKTGQLRTRIAQLAQRAKDHEAKLLTTLINAGFATACYDGDYFFGDSHVSGASGTLDNNLTANIATPASPTAAEFEAAVLDATQNFYKMKDDQGEPINGDATSWLVMIPPGHLPGAAAALKAPVIYDTAPRTSLVQVLGSLGGLSYELAVNPRLSTTDRFFMFRTDGAVRPFIIQEELDLQVSAIAEGSEEEFKNNRHLYGINKVGNVGYGLWQGACGYIFT